MKISFRLRPGAWAKKPLIEWLPWPRIRLDSHENETKQSSQTFSSQDWDSSATLVEETSDRDSRLGGQRKGGDDARASSEDFFRKVTIIYGSPALDWMEAKFGVELAGLLNETRVDAKVYQLQYSGHLLFLDEPEELARTILEAFER